MMRRTICGKRYDIGYGQPLPGAHAHCDPPTSPGKRIVLSRALRKHPRLLLRYLIHECQHAGNWNLDDEWVTQFSEDLEKVLWDAGFRFTDEGEL